MTQLNREIKFRAWIPDEEAHGKMFMLPFSDGEHIDGLNENGTIDVCRYNDYIVKVAGLDDENISEGFQPCEAIIMQFTGLKDQNGKEIYEGDILKDEYNRMLLVEWWQYAFTLKAITKTNFVRANYIIQWFIGVPSLPEIIGNIYENPELLDVKT